MAGFSHFMRAVAGPGSVFGRLLALAGLLAAVALPAAAQPVQIPQTPTSLRSVADRMISYRNQDHMWQTSDGVMHVLMNRGAPLQGSALVLMSSFNGGSSWVVGASVLEGSDYTSTSDGYLANDELFVSYSGAAGELRYAQLHYDALAKTWGLVSLETVLADPNLQAITPALAADAFGRTWLSFTRFERSTGNYSIKLFWRGNAGTAGWTDTGFTFGPVDNLSNERSARPIATSRGMGLVFSVHQNLYWSQRLNAWPTTALWPRSLVYTNLAPDSDPFGTHYSVTADEQMNLHMASADGGQLVYSRFDDATQKWATRIATGPINATYMQVVSSMGNVIILCNDGSVGRVFQSSDSGTTFRNTHLLTHPAATPTTLYDRPRIEAPVNAQSPIPVLQQFTSSDVQRAMFFAVPVVR